MSDLDDKARAALKPLRDLIHESCYQREAELEAKLAEAQAGTALLARDVGNFETLAIALGAEVNELKATLKQALETLGDLITETGPVYDPIATAEARARAVAFLDVALDAGKET